MKLSKYRAGLAVASFLGLLHLVWLVTVGLNWGQTLLDWYFEAHRLTNPFTVMALDWPKAAALLAMVLVGGYVGGWVFAACWNKFAKK